MLPTSTVAFCKTILLYLTIHKQKSTFSHKSRVFIKNAEYSETIIAESNKKT